MANLPDEVRIKNNPGRAGIDGIRVRGGFFSVATEAERFNLDDDVRRAGMQVYDAETDITWKLLTNGPWNYDASDWTEVVTGGGGGGGGGEPGIDITATDLGSAQILARDHIFWDEFAQNNRIAIVTADVTGPGTLHVIIEDISGFPVFLTDFQLTAGTNPGTLSNLDGSAQTYGGAGYVHVKAWLEGGGTAKVYSVRVEGVIDVASRVSHVVVLADGTSGGGGGGGGDLPVPGTDIGLSHYWTTVFPPLGITLLSDLITGEPTLFEVIFNTDPGTPSSLELVYGDSNRVYLVTNSGTDDLVVTAPLSGQINGSSLPVVVAPGTSAFFRNEGGAQNYWMYRLTPLVMPARVIAASIDIPDYSSDYFVNQADPVTMTLHSTPRMGQRHMFKDMNSIASSSPITLNGNGYDIEQFAGGVASTLVLDQDGDAVTIQFNGTFWSLV